MNQNTISQQFQLAAEAAKKHQYWPALEHYTELLSLIDPKTADHAAQDKRLIALRERGRLLGLLGEQKAALSAYEQYHREAVDTPRKIDALINIADQSRGIGRYDQALTAYHSALSLAAKQEDTINQGRAVAGIGLTKMVRGRVQEAIDYLNEAITLFEQTDDAPRQIRTLNQMGVAHAFSGQMDLAIAAFKNALNLSRKLGQQDTAVAALDNLGECHQHLFDFEQALRYHEEGLALAQAAHLRLLEADICRNMGLELCQLGRIDEGLTCLQHALTISQEAKHSDYLAQTHYALTLVELERGNLETARQHATQLQEMAARDDSRNMMACAHYALGLYHQEKGDKNMAERMWQQTLFLAHEASNRALLWQTHAALAAIAATPDLAQVHRRIAAEVIHQIAEPIADEALRQKFLAAPPVQAVLQDSADRDVRHK